MNTVNTPPRTTTPKLSPTLALFFLACLLIQPGGCSEGSSPSLGDGGGITDTADAAPDGLAELWPCSDPGKSCNAHDPCAIDPVCGEDLLCHPTSWQNCDDHLDCTRDICKGSGLCEYEVNDGACMLSVPAEEGGGSELRCFQAEERHPYEDCMVCDPEQDPEQWTPANGGSCDDDNPCTKDDYCQAGVCSGADYSQVCQTEYSCAQNECDGKGGCLGMVVKSGWCLIDGECYQDQQTNPVGGCSVCDTSLSQTAWTSLPDSCLIGNTCYSKGDNHPGGCAQCKPDQDPTAWTLTSTTHCLIGGACHEPGQTYGCGVCDPSQSQTAWTPIAGCTCSQIPPTVVDDQGSVGSYTSLAFGSNGVAHIAYYDYGNYDLKYATNGSGAWVTTIIDSAGDMGEHASMDVDNSDQLHIAYYDYINDDLRYATNASGAWVTSIIDAQGDVGKYTSIKTDSSGKVHVAYYDSTNGDLKYATNTSGSWVLTVADSQGDMGEHASLDIDSNGKAHIAYYDYDNYDLKYTTNTSGSWVSTTIDSTGDMGEYASLALDSGNKVHIAYYDYTNNNLRYATNATGAWVTSDIDNQGMVGRYASLAIDSADTIYVSYYDSTNSDLKLATGVGGSWSTTAIDTQGDVGEHTSVAVHDGQVGISYRDYTNSALKYVAICP